ncbi:branched-chain amino acid transporter permease [Anaerococcus lactolyticus]|uniref:Branched-chain amino acid transporter n=2 Tax=Anaerococcus lactolyticus TaxID=33032 RepID=A0A095Z635_9FIRM|nr:AzlD domain-containing protein [Anaerococcus lactolyticus]KGF03939.1 branched-chain amino acid transporter [Anaerococcus lactolyticus S7-1-13]
MTRVLIMIFLSSLTTFLIRSTPFLFFSKKEIPDLIKYFGKYLPFALMPLLVIFAIRNINLMVYPYGLPEIIASLSVIILHAKFRKLFLSISIGTFIYMVLIQLVFV